MTAARVELRQIHEAVAEVAASARRYTEPGLTATVHAGLRTDWRITARHFGRGREVDYYAAVEGPWAGTPGKTPGLTSTA